MYYIKRFDRLSIDYSGKIRFPYLIKFGEDRYYRLYLDQHNYITKSDKFATLATLKESELYKKYIKLNSL